MRDGEGLREAVESQYWALNASNVRSVGMTYYTADDDCLYSEESGKIAEICNVSPRPEQGRATRESVTQSSPRLSFSASSTSAMVGSLRLPTTE